MNLKLFIFIMIITLGANFCLGMEKDPPKEPTISFIDKAMNKLYKLYQLFLGSEQVGLSEEEQITSMPKEVKEIVIKELIEHFQLYILPKEMIFEIINSLIEIYFNENEPEMAALVFQVATYMYPEEKNLFELNIKRILSRSMPIKKMWFDSTFLSEAPIGILIALFTKIFSSNIQYSVSGPNQKVAEAIKIFLHEMNQWIFLHEMNQWRSPGGILSIGRCIARMNLILIALNQLDSNSENADLRDELFNSHYSATWEISQEQLYKFQKKETLDDLQNNQSIIGSLQQIVLFDCIKILLLILKSPERYEIILGAAEETKMEEILIHWISLYDVYGGEIEKFFDIRSTCEIDIRSNISLVEKLISVIEKEKKERKRKKRKEKESLLILKFPKKIGDDDNIGPGPSLGSLFSL